MPNALVIGSSDGIGLALVRRLLALGWTVTGVSRRRLRPARLDVPAEAAARYRHVRADVRASDYRHLLEHACRELDPVDACIYCAGIGELLDPTRIDRERAVFETNLMGLISTIEVVLPGMLAMGRGHIIGLSSQADTLSDPGAPSYSASKAGMSAYLERLALALRSHGVHVTNMRLGFVDTKMAKSAYRPFLISPDRAAGLVLRCLERRPIRFTHPWRMAVLLWLAGWPNRLRIWLS